MSRYIFEQVHTRRIGFCYDIGHQHCRTPDVDLLGQYRPRLMALHLYDNDGQTSVEGRKDQHRLPFDDTIDWRVMMKKIAQLDYRGSICLEVKNFFYEGLPIETFLATAFERSQQLEHLQKVGLPDPKND